MHFQTQGAHLGVHCEDAHLNAEYNLAHSNREGKNKW